MKNSIKNGLTITVVIIIVVIFYIILAYYLKDYFTISQSDFKNNEFGDFIGGLLNPIFTLLSTVSIIYLTYIVSKGEDIQAEKAIETQKRITVNQMRQTALENLLQKTNLYIYEIDKISIHSVKNKFQQLSLTRMITQEGKAKEHMNVWLIMLCELENFRQLKYLFSELFRDEDFQKKYTEFIEVTSILANEQGEISFVNNQSIEKYIRIQQEFLTIIGNYIYSEF